MATTITAAARDFLLGRLKGAPGIVFRLFEGAVFSDGALKAIEEAKRSLFQHDEWMDSIRMVTAPAE